MRTLLSKCSILCVQEHWLSDSQLPLGSLNQHFSYDGVSGFGNDEVLSGRPYGGFAVLWRNDIGPRCLHDAIVAAIVGGDRSRERVPQHHATGYRE